MQPAETRKLRHFPLPEPFPISPNHSLVHSQTRPILFQNRPYQTKYKNSLQSDSKHQTSLSAQPYCCTESALGMSQRNRPKKILQSCPTPFSCCNRTLEQQSPTNSDLVLREQAACWKTKHQCQTQREGPKSNNQLQFVHTISNTDKTLFWNVTGERASGRTAAT